MASLLALYQSHYSVRYLPRGLSANICYLLCLVIVLIVPFFVGLAMQNFWIDNSYFFHFPEVTFTGNCALRVTTVLGKEYLWTCQEAFNQEYLYGSDVGIMPFFSMYADDKTAKGKNTDFTMLLSVPINVPKASLYSGPLERPDPMDAVAEVSFLPEFMYRVDHFLMKIHMTAAPLMRFTRSVPFRESPSDYSSGPLCALTEADVNFHSTERLISSIYVGYTKAYTGSPLVSDVKQPSDLMNLPDFAQLYAARNQSVITRTYTEAAGGLDLLGDEEYTRSMLDDLDGLNAFTWRIHLRVTEAPLFYIPSNAASVKWLWVQYFAIAYAIQWVLWWVRGMVVNLGIVETQAVFSTRTVR